MGNMTTPVKSVTQIDPPEDFFKMEVGASLEKAPARALSISTASLVLPPPRNDIIYM